MPRLTEIYNQLFFQLSDHYGLPSQDSSRHDPSADHFERLIRVALELFASHRVAELAWTTLRDAQLLEPDRLAAANLLELDEVFKHDRVALRFKSLAPLQKLARWVSEQVNGLDQLLATQSTQIFREELRSINGIGLARADALLLFAFDRPSYPLDRATYRIFVRHGWIDPTADYDEAREVVEKFVQLCAEAAPDRSLPDDVHIIGLLKRFVSWFDRLGREYCKLTLPRCEQCPIRSCLPESGFIHVESS